MTDSTNHCDNSNNISNTLRILIIGDCQTGKTSLLLKYLLNSSTNQHDVNNNGVNNSNNNNTQTLSTSSSSTSNDITTMSDDLKIENKFDYLQNYKPTSLSIYKCQVKINSVVHKLVFTDPNGNWENEKFCELRQKYYLCENVSMNIILFNCIVS